MKKLETFSLSLKHEEHLPITLRKKKKDFILTFQSGNISTSVLTLKTNAHCKNVLPFTASLIYSAGERITCEVPVIQNHTVEEAHWSLEWGVRTGQEKNAVKLPIKHQVMLKLKNLEQPHARVVSTACGCKECICDVQVACLRVVTGLTDGCSSGLSHNPECNLLERMYWVGVQRQGTPSRKADRRVESLSRTHIHTLPCMHACLSCCFMLTEVYCFPLTFTQNEPPLKGNTIKI